jgi:hypothetical protein
MLRARKPTGVTTSVDRLAWSARLECVVPSQDDGRGLLVSAGAGGILRNLHRSVARRRAPPRMILKRPTVRRSSPKASRLKRPDTLSAARAVLEGTG